MGADITVRPTAAGMAITMENRTAASMRSSVCSRFPLATARLKEGIREEESALETATGMLKSSWYCPRIPQRVAMAASELPR